MRNIYTYICVYTHTHTHTHIYMNYPFIFEGDIVDKISISAFFFVIFKISFYWVVAALQCCVSL